jgi:prepilin-type processing-associated H-X9-DG protein
VDLPGSYHENGGTFSFADGSVELHKWKESAQSGNAAVRFSTGLHLVKPVKVGDADISWVSFHTPRKSEQHY